MPVLEGALPKQVEAHLRKLERMVPGNSLTGVKSRSPLAPAKVAPASSEQSSSQSSNRAMLTQLEKFSTDVLGPLLKSSCTNAAKEVAAALSKLSIEDLAGAEGEKKDGIEIY